MMNKIWGAITLLFLAGLGFIFFKEYMAKPVVYDDSTPIPSTIEQIKPEGKNFIDINFGSNLFRIVWIKITEPSSLSLFSNLPDSQTAEKLMQEKSCKFLVNGGFYSKESRPIGIFISEGEKLNKLQKNNLFNGVFSVSNNNVAKISSDINESNVRFAVQSGPILISDGQLQQINLRTDNGERRTVVAQDKNNQTMFLSIFKPESVYLGPYLADLPDILREFEKKSGNNFTFALNLDGGTASAFYSDSVSLPELSPIGSYFCIKS